MCIIFQNHPRFEVNPLLLILFFAMFHMCRTNNMIFDVWYGWDGIKLENLPFQICHSSFHIAYTHRTALPSRPSIDLLFITIEWSNTGCRSSGPKCIYIYSHRGTCCIISAKYTYIWIHHQHRLIFLESNKHFDIVPSALPVALTVALHYIFTQFRIRNLISFQIFECYNLRVCI